MDYLGWILVTGASVVAAAVPAEDERVPQGQSAEPSAVDAEPSPDAAVAEVVDAAPSPWRVAAPLEIDGPVRTTHFGTTGIPRMPLPEQRIGSFFAWSRAEGEREDYGPWVTSQLRWVLELRCRPLPRLGIGLDLELLFAHHLVEYDGGGTGGSLGQLVPRILFLLTQTPRWTVSLQTGTVLPTASFWQAPTFGVDPALHVGLRASDDWFLYLTTGAVIQLWVGGGSDGYAVPGSYRLVTSAGASVRVLPSLALLLEVSPYAVLGSSGRAPAGEGSPCLEELVIGFGLRWYPVTAWSVELAGKLAVSGLDPEDGDVAGGLALRFSYAWSTVPSTTSQDHVP